MSISTILLLAPFVLGALYVIISHIARKTSTRVDDEIATTLKDLLRVSRGGDIIDAEEAKRLQDLKDGRKE